MKKKCSNVPMFQCSNVRAFTVIEMVVVLGITAFLAGLLIANMHSGGESMDLTSEVQKLGGVVRQAQMMALTGKQIESSGESIRPSYGYGVYIISDSYILFANSNEPNPETPSYQYESGSDIIIQNFTFADNITATSDSSTIVFALPSGNAHSTVFPDNMIVTLTHESNLNSYLVISPYGKIDIHR